MSKLEDMTLVTALGIASSCFHEQYDLLTLKSAKHKLSIQNLEHAPNLYAIEDARLNRSIKELTDGTS